MLHTWTKIVVATVAVLALASSASASDALSEINQRIGLGDPVAGKEKSALCQSCHGEDGNSTSPDYPKLAGQHSDYIQKQIRNFWEGSRMNSIMSDVALNLTQNQDLRDITAYFASQKQMKGTPNKTVAGEALYSGAYHCANCHGEEGKGRPDNNSLFPVIGGQHKDYLIKQLKDFRSGQRKTDMSGTMNEITNLLTDAEIEAVSDYLSGR